MEECIFCKIIKGELPAQKVYEDPKVLAFLDINPVNRGHVLVIPKEHYMNMLDAPLEVVENMLFVVKKIAPVVMNAVGANGFNFNSNHGRAAGQVVDHIHFHIVPRFDGDGYELWQGKPYAEGEMQSVAAEIKKNL